MTPYLLGPFQIRVILMSRSSAPAVISAYQSNIYATEPQIVMTATTKTPDYAQPVSWSCMFNGDAKLIHTHTDGAEVSVVYPIIDELHPSIKTLPFSSGRQ